SRPASKPGLLLAPQEGGNVTGQTAWIESLSPWPEEFGLGTMRALLAGLGEPQRACPAIHVVGTNGKSTATRRAAAFLHREGVYAGAYTSPHVSGWSERIQVGGEGADFDAAIARIRAAAQRVGATQFEALTAAALSAFAAAGVEDVFAGAHNPAGGAWLVDGLPRNDYVVCAAVLADKDVRAMLGTLRTAGRSFVATQAETERSLPADALAAAAREFFAHVES